MSLEIALSFLEIVSRARTHLREQGRISLRALRREFDLDEALLEELIEELVEIQQVAVREERALAWNGAPVDAAGTAASSVATAPTRVERAPVDYTPKHLADKILQSKSALEGERKQVTVLFADVKGSMDLAEQVDPEQWHRILDRFFQILSDGVHRFEGTINQYTGDGIMALFGAPIAHEDHAQRACYAALALRDELRRYADELRLGQGLNFGVRMGLNSGEVIVGKIGDDLRMDYTAQGHTVGLAQRLEQLASTDSAFLTEHTARLAEGYFELRDLGESKVRGGSEPLHIFELMGVGSARTRLDVSRSRGLTKFVGRHDEMATLEAALERAGEGHGQVLGVVAEAGAGKSRLCFEFLERCRANHISVYEARGVAHGAALPFLPIRELFRGYYGIAEQDTPAEARQKIAGQLLLVDEAFRELLPVVFDFLGVPDPGHSGPLLDPEARQRELRRLMRGVSQAFRGTQVTLLEDLHWFDEGSREFLEQLVEVTAGTGALVLVNFRPEFHASWMQKSHYQQLPLVPLGPEAIRVLLGDLLGPDSSVAALPEVITDRTAGNPFFVEETIQSLIEAQHLEGTKGAYRLATSVDHLPLPSTVQAVLAARIDRLPEREKHVLQTAAVIGKEFAEPLLAELLQLSQTDHGAALDALKDGEFLYETALYPTTEYAFKHPLTQEVAYDSQLTEGRARVHAAVAKAVEHAHSDELDKQAALLAHHWEQAGNALEAARWHARAARWGGTSSVIETIRHWQRVRGLLENVAETPEIAALLMEACVQVLSGASNSGASGVELDEITAIFEQATQHAERSGNRRALANLHSLYGGMRGGRFNDVAGHCEITERAVAIAEESGEAETLIDALLARMAGLMGAGHLSEAIAAGDRALKLAPEDGRSSSRLWGYEPLLMIRVFRGATLSWMGRLEEGKRELERAAESARADGQTMTAVSVGQSLAENAELLGDAQAALEHALKAVSHEEKCEGTWAAVMPHASLASAHLMAGNLDAAIDEFARWENMINGLKMANSGMQTSQLHGLAEAKRQSGDLQLARSLAETVVSTLVSSGTASPYKAQLVLLRVLLQLEGPTSLVFVETLAAAERRVEETEARAFLPPLLEVRAERGALLEDADTQHRELCEAKRLYSEIGATGHATRLARELEALGQRRTPS